MAFKKEQQFVFGSAVVLLIVGVISYVAFSGTPPERPVRIMFDSIAGKVLFDHKTHFSESGYGLSCQDCHHTLEAGDTAAQSCQECHEPEGGDASMPKRSDAFHQQCIGCHQQIEAGPRECSGCHVL
jgi:hypothetical protein